MHISILLAALKKRFHRGGSGCGKKSLFSRLKIKVGVNDIRQIYAVEQIGGLVPHLKHQRACAAIFFLNAIFACFVGITAGAGDQSQRTAHDPDEVAIADIDRRNAQPIAAVFAALRRH